MARGLTLTASAPAVGATWPAPSVKRNIETRISGMDSRPASTPPNSMSPHRPNMARGTSSTISMRLNSVKVFDQTMSANDLLPLGPCR